MENPYDASPPDALRRAYRPERDDRNTFAIGHCEVPCDHIFRNVSTTMDRLQPPSPPLCSLAIEQRLQRDRGHGLKSDVSTDAIFDLVKTLTELPGPVGHEDAVQDWIVDRWGGFAQEVRRTRVDNVLARVGGSGKRLVIMAHADEICFMVKSHPRRRLPPPLALLRRHPRLPAALGDAAQPTRARPDRDRHRRRGLRDRERARRRRTGQTGRPLGMERLVHRHRRRQPVPKRRRSGSTPVAG